MRVGVAAVLILAVATAGNLRAEPTGGDAGQGAAAALDRSSVLPSLLPTNMVVQPRTLRDMVEIEVYLICKRMILLRQDIAQAQHEVALDNRRIQGMEDELEQLERELNVVKEAAEALGVHIPRLPEPQRRRAPQPPEKGQRPACRTRTKKLERRRDSEAPVASASRALFGNAGRRGRLFLRRWGARRELARLRGARTPQRIGGQHFARLAPSEMDAAFRQDATSLSPE